MLNSLAAIAIGVELDFGIKAIKNGFKHFAGVKRRFTKVCEHHPVEIKATLATAKSIAEKRKSRVIAIFQPHRYSRVKDLFYEFTTCFSDSDKLYVLDIYIRDRKPIDGITSQALIEEMVKLGARPEFIANPEYIAEIIKSNTNQGDLIVMMGAGSISSWAWQLPDKFAKNS